MHPNEKIKDHYFQARNVGKFTDEQDNLVTGRMGCYADGLVMQIQLRLNSNDEIADAKYQVFGSAAAIACCSLLTELVIGKTIEAAQAFNSYDLISTLELRPEQQNCAMLAEDTLHAALAKITEQQIT